MSNQSGITATGADVEQQTCRRCGTCCIKGGPALHSADKDLVMGGYLPATMLFTIRKGEPAFDNIKGQVDPADTDIIKIKNSGTGQGCRFLKRPTGTCEIYDRRPIECRLLECWNTEPIERVYMRNRLERRNIIGAIDGLWDLVATHQERCSYETISDLAAKLRTCRSRSDEQALLEIVRYDAAIRDLVVKKSGVDSGLLLFLFGRPLVQTCGMFDFHINADGSIHYV